MPYYAFCCYCGIRSMKPKLLRTAADMETIADPKLAKLRFEREQLFETYSLLVSQEKEINFILD